MIIAEHDNDNVIDDDIVVVPSLLHLIFYLLPSLCSIRERGLITISMIIIRDNLRSYLSAPVYDYFHDGAPVV